MSNVFGNIFRLTSFGESHGPAIGGVIDGMPAGLELDISFIQRQLDRRKPGSGTLASGRRESDSVSILSGVFNGVTLGTPIGFVVENRGQRSEDYDNLKDALRPSHADYTYLSKYGTRDHRGGGRASARETVSRVVAGAIAMQALAAHRISVKAYVSAVGNTILAKPYTALDLNAIDRNPVRCPDPIAAEAMENEILRAAKEGDTVGGVVTCIVSGVPAGFGDPVFGKLQARLAAAMMSINAAKGFEYGMGFEGCRKSGSLVADPFYADDEGRVRTSANNSGGIQGGISNGEDIYFNVAFKPTATRLGPLETINMKGEKVVVDVKGRHDPCVAPRAVPIVEAMAACVIFDALLSQRLARI